MKFCGSSSSSVAIKRFAVGVGLICCLLGAAAIPVAAQEETPFHATRMIVDAVPEGYQLLASSAHLQLHMHPQSAKVAILDLRSSRVWLSSPPLPPGDEVPESLHGKFSTVFFAFFTREQSTQMRREDSVSKVTAMQIEPSDEGAAVRYEMDSLGVAFTLRYRLGPDYLEVRLDEDDLVESEKNLIVGIEFLPYLGAVPYRAETSAYYVLPDGPGALTYIGRQVGYRKPYSAVSYGTDRYSFARPSVQRNPLPIYGIVTPRRRGVGRGHGRRGGKFDRSRHQHRPDDLQPRKSAPGLPQADPVSVAQGCLQSLLRDGARGR